MNLQTIIFAVVLIFALTFLIAAVTTDHWSEIKSYGSSHTGLWRACYKFTDTKTKVCVTFDHVPVSVHVARAGLLTAAFSYVVVLVLLYFTERKVLKNFRIPAMACFFPFSSTLAGMAAFTADVYRQADVLNISFAWSYYFGWTSLIILVAAIMIGIKEKQRTRVNVES